ncbi:DUF4817 domain-containing protein [Trichonephila clavipes]|nr:DUF4817 domain-containing protein [Trichonephila clavipes]
MNRYTSTELVDIHFIYGLTEGNESEAVQFYGTSIEGTGWPRTARIPMFEEGVLHAVNRNPGTSVWAFAAATGTPQTTVPHVQQGEAFHPFHVQRVQLLQQRQACTLPIPCCSVMKQSFHEKECAKRTTPASSIVGDSSLRPYILPPRLDSDKYLVFLHEVLPQLLTDVPSPIRRRLWFQQDGAPSHYGRCLRDYLDQAFPKRGIGRGLPWSPRSSYLSPLVVRISNAAATIPEMLLYFVSCVHTCQ